MLKHSLQKRLCQEYFSIKLQHIDYNVKQERHLCKASCGCRVIVSKQCIIHHNNVSFLLLDSVSIYHLQDNKPINIHHVKFFFFFIHLFIHLNQVKERGNQTLVLKPSLKLINSHKVLTFRFKRVIVFSNLYTLYFDFIKIKEIDTLHF